MEYKKFDDTYIVRIEKGEEIIETLEEFCESHRITAASLQGIGATDDAEVGYYDTGKEEYFSQHLTGDHEIAPMVGNVTMKEGDVHLHIHINLAGSDQKAMAGHLNRAVVSATCEVFIDVLKGDINRKHDEETGLDLMDLK